MLSQEQKASQKGLVSKKIDVHWIQPLIYKRHIKASQNIGLLGADN